jgi:hypothetical protein
MASKRWADLEDDGDDLGLWGVGLTGTQAQEAEQLSCAQQENEQLPCAQQEDEQALTFRPCTWQEAKALYNITSKLAKPRQALISVLNGLSLEDACKVAAAARVKLPNDRKLQQNTYLLFHCKVRGLPKPELAW